MKKAIIIIIWAIFLTVCLVNSAHGQNKKPVTKPDTCRIDHMNVLRNDKDPNGDSMRITKFNGIKVIDRVKVVKEDTGIFSMDKYGNLTAKYDQKFQGHVLLNYSVIDGKVKDGIFTIISTPISKGNIVCIRKVSTIIENAGMLSKFTLEFAYIPNCTDVPDGLYRAVIRYHDGRTFSGWVFSEPHNYVGRDANNNPVQVEDQYPACFMIYYTGEILDGQPVMGMTEILPAFYNYIVSNSCRR